MHCGRDTCSPAMGCTMAAFRLGVVHVCLYSCGYLPWMKVQIGLQCRPMLGSQAPPSRAVKRSPAITSSICASELNCRSREVDAAAELNPSNSSAISAGESSSP